MQAQQARWLPEVEAAVARLIDADATKQQEACDWIEQKFGPEAAAMAARLFAEARFFKNSEVHLELQAHMISLVKMISLAWKGVHIFGTNKLKEMMSLPYCRKPHPLTAPKSLRGDIASKRECLPLIIGKEIFGNGMAVAMNRCRPRKSMPRCGLS